MVGLITTSSKRAYAIPRSAATRAPAPADLYLHRRHSNTGLAQSLWASEVGLVVAIRRVRKNLSLST